MKLNSRLLNLARKVETAFAITIFLGLTAGVLAIFQAREISRVISLVFLSGELLAHLTRLIIIILIIILFRAAFSYAADISANLAARKVKQDLQGKIFDHIINLGPNLLKSAQGSAQPRTGELVNLALEGMDAIEIYFRQYLPQIALAALIPITILIFVFPSDLLSGLILLLTAPLLPLFMYLIGSAAEKLTRKQWIGLSRMSAYFLDILQGLTTLKALGRSREQIAVINKVSENFRETTMGVLRVTFISALVLELIATLSTAVVAVEIGLRLLYGRLVFEQAFFLLLLAPEFYQPLRLLGARFHAGMTGVEAAHRIFQILDIPISAEVAPLHSAEASTIGNIPPLVQIKDLDFSYPGHAPALQDLNFEIPPGKITALIGESGAGKTTLIWLLLGFLQAEKGTILVNGHPLGTMPVTDWQAYLAWVPQNPYLFNNTILANIQLAKPDADQFELLKAVQLAHADKFIRELPMGYQTIVGEHGVRLSAGQAQQIALARAFLKGAPFIILDEATSHLDPEADRLIRDSLVSLAQDRTILVIAHHRATLSMAHQVITLSQGRIKHIQSTQPTLPVTLPYPTSQSQTEISIGPDVVGVATSQLETNTKNSIYKISLVRRLFKLITPFAGRILLSVLLGFATVASGVGLMATAAYIISAAALHPSIADLQVAIVGVRFFGLSRGVFRYLERLVSHDVTFRLLARWRVWFYQALEPLAPARLMRYHSADLLTRVISDIGALENFYVRSLAPPLVALLVMLATLFIMNGFSTALAAGLFFFLLLAGLGLPILVYRLSHHLGQQIAAARTDLSILLVDTIQGIADLLIYGQAKSQRVRLNQASAQLNRLQYRLNGVASLYGASGTLLSNLAMLAILVLAIQSVNLGQMDGVYLGVVSLIALTCFEALQPLPMVAQFADSNQAAASRLYELVDAPAEIIDPLESPPLPELADIQVNDLTFEYPLSPEETNRSSITAFGLSGVSFSFPTGKHIALVGPNGSGKTTLVSLLLRFWEYQQGSIRLEGHEFRDYCQSDIRRYLAVISQDTYLFAATIKENLLIVQPQASDEQLMQACQAAQLEDFVKALPSGLDTWIGEHGMRLSGGERQRLAIARAILKASPILVLDEPTANLDPTTELAVMNSIQKIGHALSTLTITQRMNGLESMDQILVIKNGRIIEQGLHQQLLDSGGLYSQMWNLYHQEL